MAANKPPTPSPPGSIEGAFSAPPPNAPRETSRPLQKDAGAIAGQPSHQERAAENERQLKPLVFASTPQSSPDPALAPLNPTAAKRANKPTVSVASASTTPSVASTTPSVASTEVVAAKQQEPSTTAVDTAPGIHIASALPHQPAASSTDSPSRGIPHPSSDPGKQVTGGWGQGPPQYFALTGDELRELVRSLFDRLNDQLDRDLRFGLACAYPQVRATVTIAIDGSSADAGINDVAFSLPAARLLTLTAVEQDSGDSPPDLLRDQLSLPKPQKTLLAGSTTGRPMYADIHR